ncbi:MAG TPA: hypothetical protein VK666_01190 [Chryseolinea sp.]|nr:hypothetical protein [Chryseolinea sp.]
MKNTFLFFILPLIISCSDNSDPNPVLEVGYPHEWIFTKSESFDPQDPSVARYTYIYTNKYAMFRDDILESYPLEDLAEEEHCLFYVAESNSSNGKTCYTIQLNSEKIRFLGVGPSTNKEEVHLYIQPGGEIVVTGNPSRIVPPGGDSDDGDYWKFYIHKMPDVDGVRTVAIESVGMPGWYISDSPPGFNYAANVVTLQEEKSLESAPKWQARDVK